MLEAVVDTNIFVSALTGGRVTGKLYDALLHEKFRLILSDETLGELINVLSRPKFGLDKSDIEKIVNFLRLTSIFVKPSERISISRDPKDNIFLECAVAGRSKFIVTGDKDLLDLESFHNIRILGVKFFLQLFK